MAKFNYEVRDINLAPTGIEKIEWAYRNMPVLRGPLLDRSLTVLERDYGKLYKGLTLEADYRGQTYTLTKSYTLYE